MHLRFIHKRPIPTPSAPKGEVKNEPVVAVVPEVKAPRKNNKAKKESEMITTEQIAAAEVAAEEMVKPEVKVVKKDRGLIERTESSKIVLTEDNRQVLND